MSEGNDQELSSEKLENLSGDTKPSMKNTKKAAGADLYVKGDEFLTQEERIAHKESLDKQGISWREKPKHLQWQTRSVNNDES